MAAVAASLGFIAAFGCEAIVSGEIPAFSCTDPNATCGTGEVCLRATGTCVAHDALCDFLKCPEGTVCDADQGECVGGDANAPIDAAADTSVEDVTVSDVSVVPEATVDTSSPPDTAPPVDSGPCRDVGCRCAGSSDCASGICGDALTLTSDVLGVTQSSVCTQPCCTSTDCPRGTVCFAAGNGGNYCVRPNVVSRAAPTAAKTAGSSCTTDEDCASGLCSNNLCIDTCCSADACAAGTQCSFGKFPGAAGFDRHYAFSCQTTNAPGSQNSTCNTNNDCKSGFCEPTCSFCSSRCLAPCRTSSACGSGYSCADVSVSARTSTNDVTEICYPATGSGTRALGAACTTSTQCLSGNCDPKLNACVDVCFADSDCASAPGWRCRPTMITVTGGGSFSVLACGP